MTTTITNSMDSVAKTLLGYPIAIKAAQTAALVSLGTITGVATTLWVWVIPVIRRAPTSHTKTTQFCMAVNLGFRYLQPFSKIIAVTTGTLAYVISRHPNPVVAGRWKYYLGAMCVMLPVAPYEITTIFPTNDRLLELRNALDQGKKDDFGDERDREVDDCLVSWQQWHTGRVVMPLIATSILAWMGMDLLAI